LEIGVQNCTGVTYGVVTFAINGKGVHDNQVVKVGLGKGGLVKGVNGNRVSVAKVGFGTGFLRQKAWQRLGKGCGKAIKAMTLP